MQHCHTKRASSLLAKPSSSAVCLQFRRSLFFHLRPHRFYSGCMMSKNSNSNSSDTEELEMPLPIANQTEADLVKPESSRARKLKTMLGVLLIVGVVAAVGVCAAVFAPTKKDERKAQDLDLETRESLYQKVWPDELYLCIVACWNQAIHRVMQSKLKCIQCLFLCALQVLWLFS